MSYTFHAQRDNAAGTLLYPFSPGDPTLRLNSGQGSPFGPVSSTTPIRVTVYHPASLVGGAVVDPTMTATFNVVSLSGDNLGGLTFQRGNVSLVFPAGSTVARVITQDDFAEIQGAVNDLAESGTAGVSISSPNGTLAVGGTASLPTLDVLAVPQSAVTGLTAALAGKLATSGGTVAGTIIITPSAGLPGVDVKVASIGDGGIKVRAPDGTLNAYIDGYGDIVGTAIVSPYWGLPHWTLYEPSPASFTVRDAANNRQQFQLNSGADNLSASAAFDCSVFAYGCITPGNGTSYGPQHWGGSGVPSSLLGSNGDFYFRFDGTAAAKNLIYHKESGAWATYPP